MGTSTSLNRMRPGLGLRLFGSTPDIGFDTGDGDGGSGGGSGDGGDTGSGGDSGGSGEGDQGGNDDGAGGSSGGDGGTGGDGGGQGGGTGDEPSKVEDLPEWAQKLIRDTRKEAGDNRTGKTAAEKKYNDTLDGIAKALGLKEDDTPPDPAKLAEELDSTKASHRSALVELAVFKAAGKYGADPEALTDSKAFEAKLEKLDPTADNFTDKLRELVKKTVEDEPKFKIAEGQAPPAKTGGQFTGGTGDSAPPNQLSVEEQRKARKKSRELSHDPA